MTTDFGFLRFNDDDIDENSRIAHYIRLAMDTKPGVVLEFLRDAWHLQRPNLIISITGGAKFCEMSPRLRQNFQMGLVSSAAATSNDNKLTFERNECLLFN